MRSMRLHVLSAATAVGALGVGMRWAPAECDGATEAPDRLARWRPKWQPTIETSTASWHLGRVTHPAIETFEDQLLAGAPARARVLIPLCGATHDVSHNKTSTAGSVPLSKRFPLTRPFSFDPALQPPQIAHFAWRGHDVVAVEGVPAALAAFKAEYAGRSACTSQRSLGDLLVDCVSGLFSSDRSGDVEPEAHMAATHLVRLPRDGETLSRTAPGGGGVLVTWLEGDFLALRHEPRGRGRGDAAALPSASFDACFDRGGLVAVAPSDREAYAAALRRLLRPGGRVLLVAVEHPPFAPGGSLGPPHSIDAAEVKRLFDGDFSIAQLQREDRLPLEPVWVERGCGFFFETTYLLTRL